MDKFLYLPHTAKSINTGPSEYGTSCFQTYIVLNIFNDFGEKFSFSPSLQQDFYQNIIKCFDIFSRIKVLCFIVNEKVIDLKIEEISNDENFEVSETIVETYESNEETK